MARRDLTMFLLVVAVVFLVLDAVALFIGGHIVHGIVIGIAALLDIWALARLWSRPV